jgi:hypothetical protein
MIPSRRSFACLGACSKSCFQKPPRLNAALKPTIFSGARLEPVSEREQETPGRRSARWPLYSIVVLSALLGVKNRRCRSAVLTSRIGTNFRKRWGPFCLARTEPERMVTDQRYRFRPHLIGAELFTDRCSMGDSRNKDLRRTAATVIVRGNK